MAQMIHHRRKHLDPARLRLSSSEPMIVHRRPMKCTWLTMVMAEPCHLNLWVFPSSKERDEPSAPCVTLGTVCVDGDGARGVGEEGCVATCRAGIDRTNRRGRGELQLSRHSRAKARRSSSCGCATLIRRYRHGSHGGRWDAAPPGGALEWQRWDFFLELERWGLARKRNWIVLEMAIPLSPIHRGK
jgi:hypothetical protein